MEQSGKTHIKYLYPQVAEALEEIIFTDKKKYNSVIKMYRGYMLAGNKGKRMRLSLDKAIEVLTEAGYEVSVSVVTKKNVLDGKAKALPASSTSD